MVLKKVVHYEPKTERIILTAKVEIARINAEVETAKQKYSAQKFVNVMRLVKRLAACVTIICVVWLIFEGLERLIANQSVDGISAIAKIIHALNLGSIIGYIAAGGFFVAWRIERTGKKRAISQKSQLQKKLERGDSYRSSSGLNEYGDTPEEE